MRSFSVPTIFVLLALTGSAAGTETTWIVADGRPRAAIVIAESPPRLVDLAAREFRDYFRTISGAELPIGTAPDPAFSLTVYVGRSAFTDELGITAEGLEHGAFRMVSSRDSLVLLGRDADFAPREPWPGTHNEFSRRSSSSRIVLSFFIDRSLPPRCDAGAAGSAASSPFSRQSADGGSAVPPGARAIGDTS